MTEILLGGIFAVVCAIGAMLAVLVFRAKAVGDEQTEKELRADKAFSQGVANVLSYMGKGRDD